MKNSMSHYFYGLLKLRKSILPYTLSVGQFLTEQKRQLCYMETNVDGVMTEVTDYAIVHQDDESEVEENPSTSRLGKIS